MNFKIFIIDDDEDFSLLFSNEVRKIDPQTVVLSAENGYRALHLLKFMLPEVPDMIFVDVRMPIMDGHEIVREIRQKKEFSTIPIIMYTASEDPEEEHKALESGATYYYQKPVTTGKVHDMLRAVIARFKRVA
jgi:CheY-like chemotaxis protein